MDGPQLMVSALRQNSGCQAILTVKSRKPAARQQGIADALGNRCRNLPDLVDIGSNPQPVGAAEVIRKIRREKVIRIAVDVWVSDQSKRIENLEPHRSIDACRKHETQFLLPDMPGVYPWMANTLGNHPKIEIPLQHAFQNPGLRCRLDVDGKTGRRLHQGNGARIEQHRETARTGNAHLAHIRIVPGNRIPQDPLLGATRQSEIANRLSGGRQGKALSIHRDQLLPQLPFQLSQLLRHTGLRHVQPLCRAGEMPFL